MKQKIIKTIKEAVVANGIEVNSLSHVMWDVSKNEYKFFIVEVYLEYISLTPSSSNLIGVQTGEE